MINKTRKTPRDAPPACDVSKKLDRRTRDKLSPARLLQVHEMLAKCWPSWKVQQTLSNQWGLSYRGIRTYIQAVYEIWQKEAKENAPSARARLITQFSEIASQAMDRGELGPATQALQSIARLEGAWAPEQSQVQHLVGVDVTGLNPQAVRQRIEELVRKRIEENKAKREAKQLELEEGLPQSSDSDKDIIDV